MLFSKFEYNARKSYKIPIFTCGILYKYQTQSVIIIIYL